MCKITIDDKVFILGQKYYFIRSYQVIDKVEKLYIKKTKNYEEYANHYTYKTKFEICCGYLHDIHIEHDGLEIAFADNEYLDWDEDYPLKYVEYISWIFDTPEECQEYIDKIQ